MAGQQFRKDGRKAVIRILLESQFQPNETNAERMRKMANENTRETEKKTKKII